MQSYQNQIVLDGLTSLGKFTWIDWDKIQPGNFGVIG